MYYPQSWISGQSSTQYCQKGREECIDLICWLGTIILDFSISLSIYYFEFFSSQELIPPLFLCCVQSWDFSETSFFLNFSSIPSNHLHSISYTVLSQQLLSHVSLQTKLRRAAPLGCSWGKERGGGVQLPRECYSLCVHLYSACSCLLL